MSKEFQMPALLFTFVINTIGIGSARYPVSIGVASSSNHVWHYLIAPEASWQGWDVVAGDLMGISPQELQDRGRSAAQLCRELNQAFAGQQLLADSQDHVEMIDQVFAAAGQKMTFSARHIEDVIGQGRAQDVIGSMGLVERTYRADQDALALREAIVLQLT